WGGGKPGRSWVQRIFIARRYSSVIASRSPCSTWSIANSGRSQPHAAASVKRPLETTSTVAICLAVGRTRRYGTTRQERMRMVLVCRARYVLRTLQSGHSQPSPADSAPVVTVLWSDALALEEH